MKAMILAAGRGTRMLPLTVDRPKPLLEVGGKPLLEHHILNLREAGFSQLVVNAAYLAQQIEAFLRRRQPLGARDHSLGGARAAGDRGWNNSSVTSTR